MTLFEILRILILGIGWPFLIIGSIFLLYKEMLFNRKFGDQALGRIMFIIIVSLFTTMYSLGITATFLIFENLTLGVKVVLPVFLIWFLIMLVLIKIIKRWNFEVLKRQNFYNSLIEGIQRITKRDFNFRINNDSKDNDIISKNTILFNEMIEEAQQKENEILETKEREEALNKMKSEFISIAAHQMRTPLSAIKWVFSIIIAGDTGEITKKQKEILEKGQISTQRMIDLVNDFLNISRIEQGKFDYNFTKISLNDIIQKVIIFEENKIKEKEINLIFEKYSPEPPLIKADSEKIFLVFQNIIENAINYSFKKGRVDIKLKYDNINLIVEIKDNGVGIPKEQQNKLFDKFFRGSNVVRMQTEGTGLGLFIAKNIIEKHHGKIEVESEEGKGTKILIYLPIKL